MHRLHNVALVKVSVPAADLPAAEADCGYVQSCTSKWAIFHLLASMKWLVFSGCLLPETVWIQTVYNATQGGSTRAKEEGAVQNRVEL